jgi:REP element-mobilizing transposase RayT
MGHTYTNLLLHAIFSTKHREPLITPQIAKVVPYMIGVVENLGGGVPAANAVPDHVHMLIAMPPSLCVSDLLRTVKTNSSKWVHETYPACSSFAWQGGYGAFSVSLSAVNDVKHYINVQQEHHRKVSFQEELILFLERHGIAYDKRYVWD